jgi:hypothetical protein
MLVRVAERGVVLGSQLQSYVLLHVANHHLRKVGQDLSLCGVKLARLAVCKTPAVGQAGRQARQQTKQLGMHALFTRNGCHELVSDKWPQSRSSDSQAAKHKPKYGWRCLGHPQRLLTTSIIQRAMLFMD